MVVQERKPFAQSEWALHARFADLEVDPVLRRGKSWRDPPRDRSAENAIGIQEKHGSFRLVAVNPFQERGRLVVDRIGVTGVGMDVPELCRDAMGMFLRRKVIRIIRCNKTD